MTKHQYGTIHSIDPKFPVGTKLLVLLGANKTESQHVAVVQGPLHKETLKSEMGIHFVWRTIPVRVDGEDEPRLIASERILKILPRHHS